MQLRLVSTERPLARIVLEAVVAKSVSWYTCCALVCITAGSLCLAAGRCVAGQGASMGEIAAAALVGLQEQAGGQETQKAEQAATDQKDRGKEAAVELDEIARQGIPRPPLPAFRLLEQGGSLLRREDIPTGDELRTFRALVVSQRPLRQDDVELIRRCTRYYVLRLTDPSEFGRRRRNLQELADLFRRARGNDRVYAIVRDVVISAAEGMFQHHIVSRVSAGIVLQLLADEESIPLLVKQIQDPAQHESVKIWCIKAIAAAALRDPAIRIRNKTYEDQALRALLVYFRSDPPPHYWTQREVIRALGAIGRPTEDLLRRDANVAREIVLFLRGQNLRAREGTVPEGPGRLVRVEAVDSLTLLVIPDNLDYNYQQVGAEIARFAAEAAFAALRDPLIDRLHSYLYVRRCYEGLLYFAGDPSAGDPKARTGTAAAHAIASGKGDPAYLAALRDMVKELSGEMFTVYRPGGGEEVPEDLVQRARWLHDRLKESKTEALAKAIVDYIAQNPPRDLGRLTPTTAPLPPWPELKPPTAGEATASEQATSAAGGSTDGTATP